MKLLGVDPGKTTGLALVEIVQNRPKLLATLESRSDTLLDILPMILECDFVICESWQTRPNQARKGAFDWNVMEGPERIGSVRTLSVQAEKKFVLQPPSVKPIGFAWANQKYTPGKKGVHQQDAVAHAVYYAVKNLGAVPLGNAPSGTSSAPRK